MSEPSSPAGTRAIASYHAHVYFRGAAEREHALRVRDWIGERFSVQLGRIHDQPIGPHPVPMYQVAFAREVFSAFVSWLMLNHGELSVLIHPNTARERTDHLVHALWLGERLQIRPDGLSDDHEESQISPVSPNTSPSLPSE